MQIVSLTVHISTEFVNQKPDLTEINLNDNYYQCKLILI